MKSGILVLGIVSSACLGQHPVAIPWLGSEVLEVIDASSTTTDIFSLMVLAESIASFNSTENTMNTRIFLVRSNVSHLRDRDPSTYTLQDKIRLAGRIESLATLLRGRQQISLMANQVVTNQPANVADWFGKGSSIDALLESNVIGSNWDGESKAMNSSHYNRERHNDLIVTASAFKAFGLRKTGNDCLGIRLGAVLDIVKSRSNLLISVNSRRDVIAVSAVSELHSCLMSLLSDSKVNRQATSKLEGEASTKYVSLHQTEHFIKGLVWGGANARR